jgi:TPR repeat protein
MFLLANAYRSGAGVPRDDARALKLYEQAAESEHAPAMQALALAYEHGELGLAPDPAESRRYAMEAEHALRHHRPDFP